MSGKTWQNCRWRTCNWLVKASCTLTRAYALTTEYCGRKVNLYIAYIGIYFGLDISDADLRHMSSSVIEINICSQNFQEIIIYKTIKKNFTAINKGYFKWDYYHFSCFHARTCTTNMRWAIHIGCWNFRSVKKTN